MHDRRRSPRAAVADAARAARKARAWEQAARRGDFAVAWALSDRIRARTTCFGDPAQPRHLQQIWNGTPLAGKHVLVRCYHGLGDTIHFARYLPMVRRAARHVTVWAQPRVIDLLATLAVPEPIDLLPLHDGAPDVDHDVDVEIMELASVFRTTIDTIPSDVPYLRVPSETPAAWFSASRSSGSSVFRPAIGLVWRAGNWDARRSMTFERLLPLFEACDAEWYAVQFDSRPHEHHQKLREPPRASIAETAALIQRLTLLLTIDSMPAHLAGALARPVWTLLAHDADWRWLSQRADSPWYRTMRLFRQPTPGDWDSVIRDVARALRIAHPPLQHRVAHHIGPSVEVELGHAVGRGL